MMAMKVLMMMKVVVVTTMAMFMVMQVAMVTLLAILIKMQVAMVTTLTMFIVTDQTDFTFEITKEIKYMRRFFRHVLPTSKFVVTLY